MKGRSRIRIRLRLLRILLLLKQKEIEDKRRQRRWCVRPLHQNRERDGSFARYLKPMRVMDPEMHFATYRMTRDRFDHLLELVRPRITRGSTHSMPLSAEERLSITLRFFVSNYSGAARIECLGKHVSPRGGEGGGIQVVILAFVIRNL